MPRVVHFEIFAAVPARAIRFYSEVFGWTFTADPAHESYWHIRTGPDSEHGIHGGLTRPYLDAPGPGIKSWVCTVEVDSIDRFAARIERCGGQIARPKFAIESVGYMLHGRDPEGNLFGLIEKTASHD